MWHLKNKTKFKKKRSRKYFIVYCVGTRDVDVEERILLLGRRKCSKKLHSIVSHRPLSPCITGLLAAAFCYPQKDKESSFLLHLPTLLTKIWRHFISQLFHELRLSVGGLIVISWCWCGPETSVPSPHNPGSLSDAPSRSKCLSKRRGTLHNEGRQDAESTIGNTQVHPRCTETS